MFFLFKIALSGLALWWGLRMVDFSHLQEVFNELPYTAYSNTFLVMCLCISLNGLRLHYIGEKLGLKNSLKSLHQLTWIGTFFNQLLPSGIGGDAYRIYMLAKQNGITISTSSIIWDRILGISCMGAICTPVLFFINLPQSLNMVILSVYCCLLGGVVLLGIFIKYPILQKYKVVHNFWHTLSYGKALFAKPFNNLYAASIASALVNFIAFYLLIVALKIPLNFWESSILYTISLFVTLIPFSISGWGIRESFLTSYFLACGLPPEKGFSLGILQGILMIATGAIGAVFYLFTKNLKNSLGTSSQNR